MSIPQWNSSFPSPSFLDPNEDPATGLERIATLSQTFAQYQQQQRTEFVQSLERQRRPPKQEKIVLSSEFESLDYEIIENELYRVQEEVPGHKWYLHSRSFNRWVVCFLIGIFTALVASLITILIHLSDTIKFHFIIGNLIKRCERDPEATGCYLIVGGVWTLYNCTLVGIAALLVLYISPVAAGSGIPQVKCFLNGVQIPGVMKFKTLCVKVVGVACAVAGGLSAGKEGPMIHSGAAIAAGISQGRSSSFGFDLHIFKEYRNDREKRDFVSAGAAAGVAAAFGAPIGGTLFSIEEGASFWKQSLTWRMFFAAMISSFTVNLVLSFFFHVGGFLSWNGLANFGVFTNINYNVWEIPIFLCIGIIGGFTGALFNWLNVQLCTFRNKYVNCLWKKLIECLLVAAVSACVAFGTLFFVDDCQPMGVNPQLSFVSKLWCPKGHYSAVANLFFQSPEESVKSLFHSPINSFHVHTLFVFAVQYFFLTLWTFGLSVPSGVFIPSLLTGAAWGRVVGICFQYIMPTWVDPGKYALAGAAAQLGGIVRMTISLTAIIVEATRNITFGLPIMLVLMVSKWVGDSLYQGLYDAHIELSEVPILGWSAPKLSRNILAKKVMRKDVVAMLPIERVDRVVRALRGTTHHGFPIVDQIEASLDKDDFPNYGHLKGIVWRSQIVTLLRNNNFFVDHNCVEMVDKWKDIGLSHFRDDHSYCGRAVLDTLILSESDMKCFIDLRPIYHQHAHRVPLTAALPSIFDLFRGLGLRFLAVVDDRNRLQGIITRKDVARYKEKENNYDVRELYVSEFHD